MGLQFLILDAGAFISGASFSSLGPDVVYITTPNVLAELIDSRTNRFLRTFPYEIVQRVPLKESLKFVSEFARECGELSVLSITDLEILALAYEIEVNSCGQSNIRERTVDLMSSKACRKGLADDVLESMEDSEEIEMVAEKHVRAFTGRGIFTREDEYYISRTVLWKNNRPEITPQVDEHSVNEVESDGEGEWIGIDNVDGFSQFDESNSRSVLCITTDFGMQNVMYQLGLGLMSVHGFKLSNVRYFAKGCYVCNRICHDVSREFCEFCGGHTLTRVSVKFDKGGKPRYKWIKTRELCNSRGKIFSVKKARGGRLQQDIILREDELMQAKAKRGIKERRYDSEKRVDGWFDSAAEFARGKLNKHKEVPSYGPDKRNPNEAKNRLGKTRRKKRA